MSEHHLYLSRLNLDPLRHEVQRALADSHDLHQLVMTAFPTAAGPARQAFGVLYRLDIHRESGIPTLLVQSAIRPDWSALSRGLLAAGAEPAVKEASASYEAIGKGATLRFRLRANPTKRVPANRPNDPLAGKRVDLLSDDQREEWIKKKLSEAGCRLAGCTIQDEATLRGSRAGQRISHGAVVYDGLLRVDDPAALRAALRQGIGAGKAYGFGLLSVAPARGE